MYLGILIILVGAVIILIYGLKCCGDKKKEFILTYFIAVVSLVFCVISLFPELFPRPWPSATNTPSPKIIQSMSIDTIQTNVPTSTSTPTPTPMSTPTSTSTSTSTPSSTPSVAQRYNNQPIVSLDIRELSASKSKGLSVKGIAFYAEQMIDGKDDTCWQYSTKNKASAYITIEFSQVCQPTSLWVKNGYWKYNGGLNQYERNSRPKKISVEFMYEDGLDYEDEIGFTLTDSGINSDWEKLDLGTHYDVKNIKINVLEIYKGTKYPDDVAISELCFKGCLPIQGI